MAFFALNLGLSAFVSVSTAAASILIPHRLHKVHMAELAAARAA